MHTATTVLRCVTIRLAALLAGCAQAPVTETPPSAPAYVPGSAYHQLMAEIAAQRGERRAAAAEYLAAAERSEDPQAAERATAYCFEHAYDADALRGARRWVQIEPDSASGRLFLARLLVRQGEVGEAAVQAQAALAALGSAGDDDVRLLGAELSEERNAQAVTRVLSRLAARLPPSPALDLVLAEAALRSGDLELAFASAAAAQASGAEGAGTESAIMTARVMLARGDAQAAAGHLARVFDSDPSAEVGLEYARVLATAGQREQALQVLDDIASRHGEEADARRLRALIDLESGDAARAWETLGALLAEGHFSDEILFYLGEVSAGQQRLEQAIGFYERVPDGPYLVAAQAALARLVEGRDGVDAALSRLAQAEARYPRHAVDIVQQRVALLGRSERPAEALAALDEALTVKPADVDLLLARGALLEREGRLDAALDDMAAAVAIAPGNALTLNALGYTLANRTRRHDEAHVYIRRAIEIEPQSPAILDSYGWVLYRLGRLPEARSYLQIAWGRLQDAEIAAHLGEVMWKQGDRTGARQIWEEARERTPDSAPLLEVIGRFTGVGEG